MRSTLSGVIPLDIAAHYALRVHALTPMTGGYLHRTWRAETSRGVRFVKRYAGRDWPCELVTATLAVQQELAETGHPVPAVDPTREGRLAVALSPEETLAVMAFAPGARLEAPLSPAAARAAGTTLGRMHHSLERLPVSSRPLIPSLDQVRERAEALLQATTSGAALPAAARELALAAAEYRLSWLRRHPPDPAIYEGAICQVVHGDYYPGNLLFHADGTVAGVVDFDFCGPRWRGLETSRAVVECSLSPGGRFQSDTASAFLKAYQMENPLPLAERRAMFHVWHHYLLFSTYPLSKLHAAPASLPHGWERLARRRHDLMVWLGDHLEELATLAARV